MSKTFNLLSLHTSKDKHPRTWICLKGLKLKSILKNLEKDVLERRGWSRHKLSQEIANRLGCAINTITRRLRGEDRFYPIPIILELLKFSKNKKKFLRDVKENIQYLKVNSASAKPAKAVYKLNENLAKVLGAFMADGSLSMQIVFSASQSSLLDKIKNKLNTLRLPHSGGRIPSRRQYYISIQANRNNLPSLKKLIFDSACAIQTHYTIELTEEYRDNVEIFNKWIRELFDIHPNALRRKKKAWRTSFSNKILARYLMHFFGVNPGPKTYDAHEPRIIQKSKLSIRKAFAKGLLMFDGCVREDGKISFSSVSRNLFSSLKQIWEKDNIKFGESISQRKGRYNPKNNLICFVLFTTANNRKGEILRYFESNTQKWKLLKWLSGDLNYVPILKKQGFSSSLEKILKILKRVKRCDTIFLQNNFECNFTTIRTHLKILSNQKKITLSNRPSCISDYISKNATILLKNKTHDFIFKKVRDKFGKDLNLADILGVHKSTFSAWRLRKNRMPIYILRKMCKVLGIDFKKVSKDNIEKMDRDIAEVI